MNNKSNKQKGAIGTGLIVLIVVGVILLLFLSSIVGTFNSLAAQKTAVETQRAQVEAQLQRRFDLIPSLVGAVRGSLNQEQQVFGEIARARTQYAGTKSGTPDRLEAASEYQSAIARLLVVMENYPELKSNERVSDLMVQLEGTENRISVARQRYNETVQTYNLSIRRFPTNLFAGMLGYGPEPFFAGQAGSENAPKVDLENGLKNPTATPTR